MERSTSAPEESSLPTLVGNALSDVRDLVRAELQLAKLEVRDDVRGLARRGAQMGVALVLALAGTIVTVLSLALALSRVLPPWSAHLVVGIGTLAIAGAWLAWLGYRSTRREALVPERTLAALQEDRRWIRQKLS